MKFIRRLLTCLVAATVLVAVLVLAAIAPPVQTWVAQKALGDRPGFSGSLESLSAGFGELDVDGLHLEAGGALLTLPSLKARLPLTVAVLRRQVRIRSLEAKGWTLDLSRSPERADPTTGAVAANVAAQVVVRAFRGVLSGWELPFDGSLDGVDLEGDVLMAAPPGKTPARVHLVLTGGGMSAGHAGAFTVEATAAAPGSVLNAALARGRLIVGMDSPRSVNHVAIDAAFPGGRGSQLEGLTLSAEVAAARDAGVETYSLNLSRGGRQLLTLLGRFPEATRLLAGTWTVDLRDSDLAPLAPDHPLPAVSAAGSGRFDLDAAFERVHAVGAISAVASHLGVVAPPLEGVGTVTLDARFDMARSGRAIRVDSLSLALAGARPACVVRALQPFDFDEGSGNLNLRDAREDWLGLSVRALPLAWLSGLLDGRTIAGGDATGEYSVRAADRGFSLHSKAPLTAAGVSVQNGDRVLASGLDLSLSMDADCGPKGWQVRWAPLMLSSAGQRLATFEAKASRPAGPEQPIAIAGTWGADLEAQSSSRAIPVLGWMTGHSASGGFTASLGATRIIDATLLVSGHAKGNSMSAGVHASISPDGAVAFAAPIKIVSESGVSALSADGTWVGEADGDWVDARLTGANVALEHLRLLAAPLAAAGGAPFPSAAAAWRGGGQAPARARDRNPFWGDWTGHVAVAFDRLRAEARDFTNIGAVFDLERGSIQMTGGRGGLGQRLLTNVTGSISFDGAAELPYRAKAAAALNEIDAAPLFSSAQPRRDPMIEGRFSVQGTLSGSGINLDDLIGRAQAEFRFTSTAGIVRLLRANVAESLPEVSSPVSDTLGSVGYAVGSVFGVRKESMSPGKSSVSKTGDAVLNFSYQVAEIGYDKLEVTAIRGPDGAIRISGIEMTAPEEHLTGSGQISDAKGLPLFKQPLSVELRLGARGSAAELMSAAGLRSSGMDSLGYATLDEPIRFGGTLDAIDGSQWTELLVKAATRKPDVGKKGG